MHSVKIEPKYSNLSNPRVGLIALATDFRIEKDFISVIKDQNIDFFVNRIHCYFPLTSENLIKMSSTVTEISEDILPNEKLDCVVYGCTSGTIAAGYENIKKKVNIAKPEAEVTTPSTAAINALKKMKIKKIAIFTPYSKILNDEVIDYFKSENFEISSNAYFDILSAFEEVAKNTRKPCVLICKTVKGKGIDFMENNNDWHHNRITESIHEQAIEALEN